MNRIQAQAAKLWQLLSAPDTATTYKQAGQVTWSILQETGTLLWLVFCLVLVFFEWFWRASIQAGRDFRTWLGGIEQSSPNRIVSEAGKAILSAGKDSMDFTLSKAKVQLGIPFESKPVESVGLPVEPSASVASVSPASPEPVSPVTSPAPVELPKNIQP